MLDTVHRPPPAPPRRRRSLWTRRGATVLVAFVAAVSVLIGPTTTRDAAQAMPALGLAPPIVAAVGGTLGAPASVLAFTPGGFAIAAGAGLAWLAWDNREVIGDWAEDAWCWMSGCEDGERLDQDRVNSEDERSTNSPYGRVHLTAAGTGGASVSVSQVCILTPHGQDVVAAGGGDVCKPDANGNGPRPASVVAVCEGAGGAIVVRKGTANNGVLPYGSKWPYAGNAVVCAPTEKVIRLRWYNSDENTKIESNTGTWTSGDSAPTESRTDTICARTATSRPGSRPTRGSSGMRAGASR
jgi:hypothetical protein